jgi:3-deoxy-D-arabino-heptulosonate 7-phosphate (DAHP) synthase
MIIAGPCLLNDNQAEIDNTVETARQLYAIDPEIRFRCKLWGGGTTPEKYKPGIGDAGISTMLNINKKIGLKIGTEIQTDYQDNITCNFDFSWIGARNSHNYSLLKTVAFCNGYKTILIKRGAGMTVDEIIGVYDICDKIHFYKPWIIERGINTFCRTDAVRWMPDFQGMLRIIQERPEINLMFDVSHATFKKEHIFPMIKAACALGVKHFMLEVYANPELTQSDKTHALSVEEFKPMYDYIAGVAK